MKHFFKIVWVVAFSTISFGMFAQIKPAIISETRKINLLQIMIDSLGQGNQQGPVVKEIKLTEKFEEVQILGDVKLFLTNGSQDKLHLEGDPVDVDHVKVNIRNRKLLVNAESKTRSRLVISVPVTGIALLKVEGDSEIFSSGIVNTPLLQIILNGTSMVSVKYKGKLDVIAGDNSELISIAEYRRIVSRN